MSLIDDGITTRWRLGAWCPTTGYPSAVAFHEERLWFANTPFQKNTMWGSVSGDYTNYAPTDEQSRVLDDNGLTYTLSSSKLNEIKWLDSGPTLVVGTLGDEWQVRAASGINNPITPTDISVVRHTSFGSAKGKALRIGGSVLFLQRSGRKIRELFYDYETDSLQAKDITIVSDHILRKGIKGLSLSYQQEPNSIIWVVRQDGEIAAMTFMKEQEVYAWHRHILGGEFNSGKAVVVSMAVVSSTETEDVVYLAVKRTINGGTKVDIETFSVEIDPVNDTDKSDFHYMDAGKKYSGVATNTMTGLTHLEGQTVDVLADGVMHPSQVVAAGQITLNNTYSKINVGLRARALIETLDYENLNIGVAPTIAQIRRIDHMGMRVLESMGFKMGPSENKLRSFSFRTSEDPMNSASPLYTGDVNVPVETGYSQRGGVVVVQENPYPLNILALIVQGESST